MSDLTLEKIKQIESTELADSMYSSEFDFLTKEVCEQTEIFAMLDSAKQKANITLIESKSTAQHNAKPAQHNAKPAQHNAKPAQHNVKLTLEERGLIVHPTPEEFANALDLALTMSLSDR